MTKLYFTAYAASALAICAWIVVQIVRSLA